MRANPTLIGVFVVGAVILGVAAVLLFGSGEYFQKKKRYILFFRDSVDGLAPGSPVKLSGVRIGEVQEIHLTYDVGKAEFSTPVTIVIFPEILEGVDHDHRTREDEQQVIAKLLKRGLRASLASESFITGQLSIALGFHPESKEILVGGDQPYPELPTISSRLSKFLKEVEGIPIKKIFLDLHDTILSIEKRVNSPEVTEVITSASATIEDYGKLGRNLNARVGPLLDSVEGAAEHASATLERADTVMGSVDQNIAAISEKLNQALATINKLAGDVDAELGPTAADLRSTLDGAKAALLDIQGAAGNLAALLSDGSPTIKDLRRALAEFSGAARSLKGLAQTLERQPESLLRGKRGD